MPRIFLLSPASLSGARAGYVRNPATTSAVGRVLHDTGQAPLGDVFAFLSGLYFRGKVTYARHFAREDGVVRVITAGDGLLPADHPTTLDDLDRWAQVDIDRRNRDFREPLERDLVRFRGEDVVLLGSIASDKYTAALRYVLGDDGFRVPVGFRGLGDMSRGSVLLKAVRADVELDYETLGANAETTSASAASSPVTATSPSRRA